MRSVLLWRKLAKGRIWRRILFERLTEPIHLNLISGFVWLFGSFRAKVQWDLVVRQQYAYGILKAADMAKDNGHGAVSVAEFGVASGAGLINMAEIASEVVALTGVRVDIYGFDTGDGMPPAVDHRDHPELYQEGDFAMDVDGLREVMPDNVTLCLGQLSETIPAVLGSLPADAPFGFVSIDVDYYSSTTQVMELLRDHHDRYLPLVVVYADDTTLETHNSRAGEMLAFAEFNAAHSDRVIERHVFFETWRIFRRPTWVKQIYFLHVLDHPTRSTVRSSNTKRYIENPYLRVDQQRERFVIE